MSAVDEKVQKAGEPDYDHLLRSNLQRVFNERDAGKRAAALEELFVNEPVMYEPDTIVSGRAAISDVAGSLLEQFGPTFVFTPEGSAVGHHGLGSLQWQAGPAGGPVAVTGTDVAEIIGEKSLGSGCSLTRRGPKRRGPHAQFGASKSSEDQLELWTG